MNDDPRLGLSIKPGEPYLRSALVGKDERIDNPTLPKAPHSLGRIWSAVLWDLRQTIGQDADAIVYHGIDYLNGTSGFQDALVGLLNADRDLFSLDPEDPEHGLFGAHKCAILNAAAARGFAGYLAQINGSSCALDMQNLAAASQAYKDSLAPPEKKRPGPPAFNLSVAGRKCAVVASGTGSSSAAGGLCLLLALVPIFLRIYFKPFSSKGDHHHDAPR